MIGRSRSSAAAIGRRRWSLRTRTALTFGVGAALVSTVLALITYEVTAHQLLSQRQTSSLRQAFVNARLFKDESQPPGAKVESVLSSLGTANGLGVLVYRGHSWFATSVLVGQQSLPVTLVRTVLSGQAAEQRISVNGSPAFAVGIPIPSVGASYFEIHSLTELRGTLDTLAIVLAAAAVATSLGGALLGMSASRRLVRPLSHTARIAGEIAAGRLDQRLPPDSDLGPLVGAFNDMVTRLQERIERDARFSADLSHELRSPLTTVGAVVELVDDYRGALPADGQMAMDLLKVEVGRFSDMVQALLEISRMDAGVDGQAFESVPVDELVMDTASALHGEVPVTVLPGARGVSVLGDKRRLQRVLANLLDNAEVHAGGATLVSVDVRDGWVEIAVVDGGPGVPATEEERIFERFYRGRNAGRRGWSTGSGLGLALVAEHVRAHRGTVRVEGATDGGAVFIVSLPVSAP